MITLVDNLKGQNVHKSAWQTCPSVGELLCSICC